MSVSPQDPIQLQVQTSIPVVPQAQVISGPERLIIDVPSAVPGPALRALTVNRNDVKRIRVGLFSTLPPVTRIVFDLNSPVTYRIDPISSGFKVTLLSGKSHVTQINPGPVKQAEANPQDDTDSQPTVGWVLQRVASNRTSNPLRAPVVKTIVANAAAPVKGVSVRFTKGQLEIHAHDATLSEVLFQIQKHTGAEIAIPAGTEQERVFVDAGPAPASQVLGELLNGSSLNFVVVGSESDPNALRSVILSRRNGFAENIPSYTPPSQARNFAVNVPAEENPPDMNQPPDEIAPPADETVPQPQPN
ncbi:MAG: AMIN domain-containing protein [Terriglobales bacterium]